MVSAKFLYPFILSIVPYKNSYPFRSYNVIPSHIDQKSLEIVSFILTREKLGKKEPKNQQLFLDLLEN